MFGNFGVNEIADFSADPEAFIGVFGKDDQPGSGLVQAGIDAGDEVVTRVHFPFVEPRLDAAFGQRGCE